MEELFEVIFVIAVALIGISSRSKSKKKASGKPAQTQQPAQKPDPSISDRKMANRRNVEAAVKAFTELIDDDAGLPDPDKPAAVNFGVQNAIRDAVQKLQTHTSIEAETKLKQRAQIVQARVKESLSGQSPVDAHGCIGGSMPDHESEGETLAEHAGHEYNRQKRLAEEAALNAEAFLKPTAQDLRRAVVMSEILDKPVALRKRSL